MGNGGRTDSSCRRRQHREVRPQAPVAARCEVDLLRGSTTELSLLEALSALDLVDSLLEDVV